MKTTSETEWKASLTKIFDEKSVQELENKLKIKDNNLLLLALGPKTQVVIIILMKIYFINQKK